MSDELTAHIARVEKVGCGHPAYYNWHGEENTDGAMLGWCSLCRKAACEDGGFDELE